MHRRLWARLVAFGVPAFLWGLTGSVVFFFLTALLTAWCIHGAVRRRSTGGKERSTRRRIFVGLVATLGLFPLLVVTLGPGTSVREQIDPEYGAYRAAVRQADAVRASENARAQASEEAAAAAAQASEEAEASRVQVSEEAQAARVQASEQAAAASAAAQTPEPRTPLPTPAATPDSGSYGWADAFADAQEGCLAEAQSTNVVVTDADRQFCDDYAQTVADRYCTADACSDPNDSAAESNDYVPDQNSGGGGTDCPPGTVPEVTEVDWENKIYAYTCVPG
jgi:hypothetical protein